MAGRVPELARSGRDDNDLTGSRRPARVGTDRWSPPYTLRSRRRNHTGCRRGRRSRRCARRMDHPPDSGCCTIARWCRGSIGRTNTLFRLDQSHHNRLICENGGRSLRDSDDPGEGSGGLGGNGGAGGKSCEQGTTSVISVNHGHSLVVPQADVTAGVAKSYDITGGGGHPHIVDISDSDFAMLQQGQSISVTSSTDASHSHDVTVSCA
jgi:hypothetical protein